MFEIGQWSLKKGCRRPVEDVFSNGSFIVTVRIMLRNYIKTAWRSLRKQRAFSVINVAGLAIGMATCLLIGLFVFDEWSYDRFHEHADRIVRVVFRGTVPGGELNEAHVMPPVAGTLKAEFPEVADATRLRRAGKPFFTVEGRLFYGEEMAFADTNFFRMFTFPMLYGDPRTALTEPNALVITRETALNYFGQENALGKTIGIKGENTIYKVTGVIEDIPHNSHLLFDMFASMEGFPSAGSDSWLESEFFTYLELREGVAPKVLEAKLPQAVEKYMGPQILEAFGMNYTAFRQAGNHIGLYLQPLTDIHLYSDFAYDLSAPGDIRYVYIFGAIAVFMLLIAGINFMNLSTAGASQRAREVGVRKVLGSSRRSLAGQFLVESILLALIALLAATGLTVAGLPVFNHLSGKALTFGFSGHWWVLPALLLFGLGAGVLAGSYPAFFLSSFRPVTVLRGKLSTGKSGLGLRSGLVIFQFFISIALIFSTVVVYTQLHYIQHKKLGYDKEQVLILQTWPLGKNEASFRRQLLQDARIVSVSNSAYVPAGATGNNNFFVHPGEDPSRWIKTLRYDVDDSYIPALGIEILAGRNFSETHSTDSLAVIINETAARSFGWDDEALDKTLVGGDNKALHVIGVVKDFHFRSLHEPITPLVMVLSENSGNLIVKTRPGVLPGLLQTIEAEYASYDPDLPLSFSFLDQRVENTYRSEQNTGRILGVFAGLTIFVSCLGLFGLATFATGRRTKEIGIRKVLGASAAGIVRMLSGDFIRLVLIAFVISAPVAGYVMNRWLQDFAYRIEIGWWMFALAGLLAAAIALLTVSFQSVKAALANPVKSLRLD